MGICKFCGQKAGIFKNQHRDCRSAYELGKSVIISKVTHAIKESEDSSQFEKEINDIAMNSHIPSEQLNTLLIQGLENTIEIFLEDGIISKEEEEKILSFKNHFNLSEHENREAYQKVVKALVLRDMFEGKLPARLTISGDLPFILQKGESIIWIFQEVECYELRTKITYEGRTQGVSIRIADGLYYRTGSFKGNPVAKDHSVLFGTGIMAVTNKNLYFSSPIKTFRTPFNKLIAITPYSDGIGIQKDGASAKPQIYKPLDGWFAYNLLSNLCKL